MSLPISEQVALDIYAAVQNVTKANGFNYTLSAQRHTEKGDKVAHLNAIVVQEDPRPVGDPKVFNTLEWWQPFGIGVFVIPVESDTTPVDTYVNLIVADVQKSLMLDRYRGGVALDTQIKAAVKHEEGQEYTLAIINVEVNYRTLDTDPYFNAK